MAYTLNYSGGTITVNDGTINTDTSLQLPGRNFSGYGTFVDQNFVTLMQNFASATNPSNAIRGQLWFDTGSNKLKYNVSPTKGVPDWIEVAGAGANVNPTFGDVSANSLITDTITTGGTSTPGTITGQWTLTSGSTLQIQKASTSVLGTVKVDGTTILIASDGTISANTESSYTLPTATTSVLGGVKVDGTSITINGSGVISASGAGGGTVTSVGLTVPTGLSVTGSPVTSSGTLGITTTLSGIVSGTGSGFSTVTVGGGLSYDGTTLSYTLPTADGTTLGGVKAQGTLTSNFTSATGIGINQQQHLMLHPSGTGDVVVPNGGTSTVNFVPPGRNYVVNVWSTEGAATLVSSNTDSFTVRLDQSSGGTVSYRYW